MLNKNKYWKSLLGSYADVLIPKAVDYAGTGASTVVGTYTSFVSNAIEGEFGFFNSDTKALIPTGAAVGPTVWIFGALKRDGQVETTCSFRLQDFTPTKAVYAAAIAQVSTATITGIPIVGSDYCIKVIETTPGYQQFPTWTYTYTAKTGDTTTTIATAWAAMINDPLNPINNGTDVVVSATSAANVVTLTGLVAGASFRLATNYDAINDLAFAAVYVTGPSYGNGTYNQVAELEFESNVFKGVTTQYPEQGANPADYGSPSVFANSANQYNIYIIKGYAQSASKTSKEVDQHKRLIILAIPENVAPNADAEVTSILGL